MTEIRKVLLHRKYINEFPQIYGQNVTTYELYFAPIVRNHLNITENQ